MHTRIDCQRCYERIREVGVALAIGAWCLHCDATTGSHDELDLAQVVGYEAREAYRAGAREVTGEHERTKAFFASGCVDERDSVLACYAADYLEVVHVGDDYAASECIEPPHVELGDLERIERLTGTRYAEVEVDDLDSVGEVLADNECAPVVRECEVDPGDKQATLGR